MNNLMNRKLTMTSQEIADLVGSRHSDVKRSIERLAERGVIQLSPLAKVENKQSNSPNRFTDAYLFNGEQGKRDSIVVVAQLSPEFTGRMVDRWQELEKRVRESSHYEQAKQHQLEVDVVALACAVAEATVTTAIKAAIEAATAQENKLSAHGNDGADFVVFDYPGTNAGVDNSAFQSIQALSAKTGLADSACRRLIEFAHVPARKIGRSGLHANGDEFIAAACKLIGESEPPKGRIKRWQHPEFGGFMLRGSSMEVAQEGRG